MPPMLHPPPSVVTATAAAAVQQTVARTREGAIFLEVEGGNPVVRRTVQVQVQ